MGGNKFTEIKNIILPLSLPGLIIGSVLTFIIAVGDYAVPTLLGGGFKPVLAQLMLSTIKGTFDLNMYYNGNSFSYDINWLCAFTQFN